jgi:predicted ATP-grasp superfamily ATP-dependent carboligase
MNIPAIVVGAGINGLGVVRSLARAGVPTWLIDVHRDDPGMWTRYGRKVKFQSLSGTQFVTSLLKLRNQFHTNPVLFVTQEKSVETVIENIPAIGAAYRLSIPEPQLMKQLMDKVLFQRIAEERGFPIPHAVYLRGVEDIAAADDITFPCILKPAVKTLEYQARFKKGYRVESMAALRDLLSQIGHSADMIAQEWIEGGDDQIFFCLQFRARERGTLASFVGRKLRSWPPAVGGTASCVPARECQKQLTDLTNAFFEAVGFFGMGSMEYKRDARTGRFMMVEPTVGRTDFQQEVATLNGINIPLAAYRYECGIDALTEDPVNLPIAWVVTSLDRWSRELQPLGEQGFPAGCRQADALWRFYDPIPWCYNMVERLISSTSLSRATT